MEEETRWKEKGESLLKTGDAKEAYRAYAKAIYLIEKKNVGKALNEIDQWIEEIINNPEYDKESKPVMELVHALYFHKAKIYGRIEHFTESKKALALSGYGENAMQISPETEKYIERIERLL
jgi:tetratricopeptide (TPR) repeat protein